MFFSGFKRFFFFFFLHLPSKTKDVTMCVWTCGSAESENRSHAILTSLVLRRRLLLAQCRGSPDPTACLFSGICCGNDEQF